MKTLSLDEIVCCLVGMKFFFLIEPYSEAQIKILVVVSHLQNRIVYRGRKSSIGFSNVVSDLATYLVFKLKV